MAKEKRPENELIPLGVSLRHRDSTPKNRCGAQQQVMKQAKIQNISETTLKTAKTPGVHPKIPKMERCDLPYFPPLINPESF